MKKEEYQLSKEEKKQLNLIYSTLINSELSSHDRKLVLMTFLFLISKEEVDNNIKFNNKEEFFDYMYKKLVTLEQSEVRKKVLDVLEATFKDIQWEDSIFNALLDSVKKLIVDKSNLKIDRYLEYLYFKEAKQIKKNKGGGVVFTPLSVSYFIEEYCKQYFGADFNSKESKILEPCIGSGQLTSVFRLNHYQIDGVEIDEDNLTITILKKWLFDNENEQTYCFDFLKKDQEDTIFLKENYQVGICNPPYSSMVNRNSEGKNIKINELEFIERLCERVNGLVFVLVPYYCLNPSKNKKELKKSFDRLRYEYFLISLIFFTKDLFYPGATVDTVLMVFDTRRKGVVGRALEEGDRIYLDPFRMVLDKVDFTDIKRKTKDDWKFWGDWLSDFRVDDWPKFKLSEHPKGYLLRKQQELNIEEPYAMLPLSEVMEVKRVKYKEDEQNGVIVNYITATQKDNGVNEKKKVREEDVVNENAITIGKYGAVFWQREPFVTSKDVITLVKKQNIGHVLLDDFFDDVKNRIAYFTELFGRSFNDYQTKLMELEVPISLASFIGSIGGFAHKTGKKTKTEKIMETVFSELNIRGIHPNHENWTEKLLEIYINEYVKYSKPMKTYIKEDEEFVPFDNSNQVKIITKNGKVLYAPREALTLEKIEEE